MDSLHGAGEAKSASSPPKLVSKRQALRAAWQSQVKLIGEMPQEIKSTETGTSRARLPKGFVLLPPVSVDDLKKDTEHDPEGAEEFVTLIRALRQSDSRSATL